MRNNYALNAKIVDGERVQFTCPQCGVRNDHCWYGREAHYCTECAYQTDIKGDSAPAVKVNQPRTKFTLQMFNHSLKAWLPLKVKIENKQAGVEALDRVSAVERKVQFRLVQRNGSDSVVVAQRLIADRLTN